MVTTRSEFAKQKADRIASNKSKMETRSMIAKQKADKTASNKSKSEKPKKIATKTSTTRGQITVKEWTPMDDAYLVYLRDRRDKYYETHIKPTHGLMPRELRYSIAREWKEMDDKDKAPYLERAYKRKMALKRAEEKKRARLALL